MRGGDTYVVDIETVGQPWAEFDDKTREYLVGRAQSEGEKEAVPRRLGLAPGTGRVIVIGMLNLSNDRAGGMFAEGESHGWHENGPQGFHRFDGSETEMLRAFWHAIGPRHDADGRLVKPAAKRIVTFNGRQFDGPFLMIRSALLGIAPTVNLVGYRYTFDPHCDLAEVLNFRGAVRSNYNLDYWCRRFGVTSPKAEGLDGSQVQGAYEDGRLDEIVEYCARDIVATGDLYEKLAETLIPVLEAGR